MKKTEDTSQKGNYVHTNPFEINYSPKKVIIGDDHIESNTHISKRSKPLVITGEDYTMASIPPRKVLDMIESQYCDFVSAEGGSFINIVVPRSKDDNATNYVMVAHDYRKGVKFEGVFAPVVDGHTDWFNNIQSEWNNKLDNLLGITNTANDDHIIKSKIDPNTLRGTINNFVTKLFKLNNKPLDDSNKKLSDNYVDIVDVVVHIKEWFECKDITFEKYLQLHIHRRKSTVDNWCIQKSDWQTLLEDSAYLLVVSFNKKLLVDTSKQIINLIIKPYPNNSLNDETLKDIFNKYVQASDTFEKDIIPELLKKAVDNMPSIKEFQAPLEHMYKLLLEQSDEILQNGELSVSSIKKYFSTITHKYAFKFMKWVGFIQYVLDCSRKADAKTSEEINILETNFKNTPNYTKLHHYNCVKVQFVPIKRDMDSDEIMKKIFDVAYKPILVIENNLYKTACTKWIDAMKPQSSTIVDFIKQSGPNNDKKPQDMNGNIFNDKYIFCSEEFNADNASKELSQENHAAYKAQIGHAATRIEGTIFSMQYLSDLDVLLGLSEIDSSN